MYAPFEKGYGTPVETWPDGVLKRAMFVYPISIQSYLERSKLRRGYKGNVAITELKSLVSLGRSLIKVRDEVERREND